MISSFSIVIKTRTRFGVGTPLIPARDPMKSLQTFLFATASIVHFGCGLQGLPCDFVQPNTAPASNLVRSRAFACNLVKSHGHILRETGLRAN